ncbi:hypothetical protein LUZ61_020269 [Rhynchospora tenuis]|uniref:KIB1-4 beta-propeller domain-containing protein n=1 Tax=Rhynchospora tenuis TaxID=198213 RepID=A0AAD5ZCQ4_9POAL|nr:hypothetical protein LUZ61_020269 [Rhynchospora tenuis]
MCQIAKKVQDISDFVRLRAVCKQWHSAVHPPTYPHSCLTLYSFTNLYGSFTGFVLLFCLKPPIIGLLLNPLTGFQALLPIENEDIFMPIYFGPSCSHEPSLDENGIDLVCLVANFEPLNGTVVQKWILWRYTDNKWRKITEMHYGHDESVVSYSSGRIYFFSYETRLLRVVDATNGNTVSLLPEVSSGPFDYIVEACGDLIGVRLFVVPEGLDEHESDYQYELYQLKDSGTNPCWAKVNDIGDRMLFHDYQCYWHCLRASDFEGCMGNCIYSKNAIINNSVKCYSVATQSTTQLHLDLAPLAKSSLGFVNYPLRLSRPQLLKWEEEEHYLGPTARLFLQLAFSNLNHCNEVLFTVFSVFHV